MAGSIVQAGMAMAGEWPQLGKFYPDGHGGYVYFPMADVSFADKVAGYRMGDPPPDPEYRFPSREALGIPDYDAAKDQGYVTLGCKGALTLQFTDNALVDVSGPDLYVFEIGPGVEPTRLAISPDGKNWVDIGRIAGGRAEVDIAQWAGGNKSFRYVRLTDLGSDCDSSTPGADIDAVGAIGSGLRLTLTGKVLFDFGKAELKPDAARELDGLGAYFADRDGLKVDVAGHTDAVGSQPANQRLSERRARAVAAYLTEHFNLKPEVVRAAGYGETQPVASNETEVGRQANRRVEIVLFHRRKMDSGIGLWQSSLGPLALASGPGAKVAGRYPEDNGRLFGEKKGRVISGYWVEDGSSRTCDSQRDGSRHWGRIHIEMNEAGDAFSGWWSYCDVENQAGSLWGKRQP
jgi:outer membrane protein OmpA-like peptidoglycan-associated protein